MNKKYINILLIIPFLTSCSNSNNTFSIEFYKDETISTFYDKSNNNINLSLYRCYDLNINVGKNEWINDKMKDNIDIKYDSSKFKLDYFYESNNLYFVKYHIQSLDIFNNEEVVISFNNNDYKININSSFESLDDYKLKENDLNDLINFKEMIDSINYYKYQNNYPGITSYDTLEGLNYISQSFSNEDYLPYFNYLKDDCYYPSIFNKPYSNGSERTFYMYFDDKCDVSRGSKKSPMISYIISSIINDQESNKKLYEMRFEAINKNYTSSSNYASLYMDNKINDEYYLLSKKYKDDLLNYQNNELDITFIKLNNNKISGYFEDETYLYKLTYLNNYYKE